MAALPAALNFRLAFFTGVETESAAPLTLAHLALAPAAILARAAGDILRRPFVAGTTEVGVPAPEMSLSSLSKDSICSRMTRSRFN